MKKKQLILLVLSITSIVLVLASVGIYSVVKPHFEPKSNMSKPSMNVTIYHHDWQFQGGKIIELEDKITLDNVEEKEFTQEEDLNKPVTRNQFVYTIKHELDTKGNKVEKDQYYPIIFRITFGVTKDGQVVKNTEAVSEEKRDDDIYYTYSTFLVPIEQICFETQADRDDMESRDVQCMKTGTEKSHKGEFPYSYKQGEVGKPVTLKQGEDEFTMTLTKVIRNKEFDESFLIFEVNPKENNQIYFEGTYYSLCGDTEICKAKSRTPEENQKYKEYYQTLLEQEKAEVYRGNTLTDFEKKQPKRFVVSARGSESKKFTFGFDTNTHANRNVYWELGERR